MRAWQGVSHGTYVNANTGDGRLKILNMLAENNPDPNTTFTWNSAGTQIEFAHTPVVSLSRPRIHTLRAYNTYYQTSSTFRYDWVITYADGSTASTSIYSNEGTVTRDGFTLAADFSGSCDIILPEDITAYASAHVAVYDMAGTLQSEDSMDILPVAIDVVRSVADNSSGERDHYVFTPTLTIGSATYTVGDPLFENLEFEWKITVNNSLAFLKGTDFDDGTDDYVAHIKSTYVGDVQLTVYDKETGTRYILLNNGTEPTTVQALKQIHLSVTMKEYDTSGNYLEFKASDYFKNKNGYNLSEVSNGDLSATNYRPLVFEATVVDQFGNEWMSSDNKDKWRIQWSYRLPGEGTVLAAGTVIPTGATIHQDTQIPAGSTWESTRAAMSDTERLISAGTVLTDGIVLGAAMVDPERCSYNYDADEGYNLVNGKYNADDTTDYGLPKEVSDTELTDWIGAYYTLRNNSDVNFTTPRTGHYMVDNDGLRFIIHPNLLHRTSAFWVRARLYDVESDPEGKYPSETIITFNQLAVDFDKVKDSDGNVINYKAKVVWRGMDRDTADESNIYTSSSAATYTWWSNPDPADVNGWTPVVVHDQASVSGKRQDQLIHDGESIDFDPNLYYKFNFHTSSGTDLTDIVGPKNVVFLYNRALSIQYADRHAFNDYSNITNQYYPEGLDINTGHDPQNAVNSIEKAFELLDSYEDGMTMDDNKIVIMGYYENSNYLDKDKREKGAFKKPMTLTGAYGSHISGGTYGMTTEQNALQAPQKWENIDIYKGGNSNNPKIYCYNHDFTVGEGVRMCHFDKLANDMGQVYNGQPIVNLTLVVGPLDDDTQVSAPSYKIDYAMNVNPELTTVKLYSGAYGRIIGGARNNTGGHNNSKNIHGAPWAPHRARIIIDLQHKTDALDEFMPSWGSIDYTKGHEIGVMAGGQTDGSVYGDIVVDLYNGRISRFAAGNISYGRPISDAPDDSFFGSTVLNVYGGSIDQLFGGSLGRKTDTAKMLNGYFYGRSIINLYGGTLGQEGEADYALYGAGAGGITGLGKDWSYTKKDTNEASYTPDPYIPYFDSNSELKYGDFKTVTSDGNKLPTMTILDHDGTDIDEELNLASSYAAINLYGGTVYGDVFGGGYGYSSSLKYEHVPYRVLSNGTKMALAGNLYGNSSVNLLPNPFGQDPVTVHGSVYGGGSGSDQYITDAEKAPNTAFDYSSIAQVFGDTSVRIEAGTVKKDVFAGGRGLEGQASMANIYGNSSLEITGGTIEGNIFGGSDFSDILSYQEGGATLGGNTSVEISGGTLGNCIFGGGQGSATTASNIDGSTLVNIRGGYFSSQPIDSISTHDSYLTLKNFNIYGGGYKNGTISGNTELNIYSSPFGSESSMGLSNGQTFRDLYDDITVRRFCVYGGGWGEKTLVKGNSSVTIDINEDEIGYALVPAQAEDIDGLVPVQTFFDVAGGGYSGDIGYWADDSGKPSTPTQLDTYKKYVGGEVSVTIKGAPFIRKVIGGAFYASCNNTDTYISGGTIKEVYGGALMGYVHNNGRLNIGTLLSDPLTNVSNPEAAELNRGLFITGNVYGGNDVKGIVGTALWKDAFSDEYNPTAGADGLESTDGEPLFCADVTPADNKGVTMSINGGSIMGNVYGAGNGHYRGYYVPGWARYSDGPDRQYRTVAKNGSNESTRVYRCRPMVGKVTMHIGGNSATDSVYIKGNVFGGGRSCTVGQWNTILPFEDPRRLSKGGFLHINFGSNVRVAGSVYMGSEGTDFAKANTVPAGISLYTFDGSTSAELNKLGDVAYDHWYYDASKRYYVPGFPDATEYDGNFGIYGEHMFRAYLKNIEINGDAEVTFYANPYEMEGGSVKMATDANGDFYPVRKCWIPGELAIDQYDASNITFTNFFGGGACGSMTNNNIMRWDFSTNKAVDGSGTDLEEYGSIYRYTLPAGLTILDKVVGGSENATMQCYKYASDYRSITDELMYEFKGGFVTQAEYNFSELSGKSGVTAFTYDENKEGFPNGKALTQDRYQLALMNGAAYCGPRKQRPPEGNIALKLTITSQFDPQEGKHEFDPSWDTAALPDSTHFIHYGGVIYGGCYESGSTQGDVIVTVGSNTIGHHLNSRDSSTFGEISSLEHNIGRVFGGGYGANSSIDGNTYVNLLSNFVGMNVFGGGCQGDVNGTAHVNYMGNEVSSFVFGAIYGGGLYGNVGVKHEAGTTTGTSVATDICLYSGNVDKVYGGACLGNLYGRTNVELCDEVLSDIDHYEYKHVKGASEWKGARLIAGTVFAGNDISGNIIPQPAADDKDEFREYSTYVKVYEVQDTALAHEPSRASENPGKKTPGASNGYNGFPLIGNLYGGSNGNYGTHTGSPYYTGGVFKMATGESNHIRTVNLDGNTSEGYRAWEVPHIDKAYLDIRGGTMINVYGGGDMSSISESTTLRINYNPSDSIMRARAGFEGNDALVRLWNTCHLTDDEEIEEVTSTSIYDNDSTTIFKYHIYRLFGGNDNADMAIQPTWELLSGHLGSVYSGGNFGKMTYFGYDESTKTGTGLTLKIDSPHFHADAVFGGGRVGDISPAITDEQKAVMTSAGTLDQFYGANLEIHEGVVDHVYGGNDVSGNVDYGSHVEITGAISGDVYCAGNGNYRYQYRSDLDPSANSITEAYDSQYGGRYFILPQKAEYGADSPSDIQKIQAINSYRPNVDRSYLKIAGSADKFAYVRGNVYCGGNSSTVNATSSESDIKFEVGDNVVLNGVYLGSNGESLVDAAMMSITEQLNSFDLANEEMLKEYMHAVDTYAQPKDFNLSKNLTNAYIGDFYVGGNSGSMLTDKTISLTFPYNLIIFNRIVGGSNNANVTYKGVTHVGGLTEPLAAGYTDKVYLQVRSQFKPYKILYPVDDDYRKIALVPDLARIGDDVYFPEGKCSIFGGCFNSGKTVGNIHVDLYSDLVKEYTEEDKKTDIDLLKTYFADSLAGVDLNAIDVLSKERIIVNGIDKLQRRSFALIGGGYGANTEVRGDIKLHMLPGQLHPDYWNDKGTKHSGDESPSAATVFGGSQLGKVVGNTEISVRDGMVLSNLYGGSEASTLYGSTQIIIGWPQYYVCKKTGHYQLDRTDNLSKAYKNDWINSDNASKRAILRDIWLREGEYVSVNLYKTLSATQEYIEDFPNLTDCFDFVDNDFPQNYQTHYDASKVDFHDITWDDIDIYIGNGKSRRNAREEYFAHGNIYGGGFITANSSTSLAGQYTVQKFREGNCNDPADIGYGGNSSIIVWDNIENSDPNNTDKGPSGAKIQDHITIGTGHYIAVPVRAGQDIMGKYVFEEMEGGKYEHPDGKTGDDGNVIMGHYVHQSSYVLTETDLASGGKYYGVKFYEIESDGGIYGGGRKVYVEGFRNCDLAYYGYADYSPQYPKLLNTAQRLDLFSVTDCCLFFEGANDFATNSVDATNYSLTRIGELKMISSLIGKELESGTREDRGLFNIKHEKPRTRNYIAFFNDVLYVAALTSNEDFATSKFRGANGEFNNTGDFRSTNSPNSTDLASTSGQNYVDLGSDYTYKQYKQNRIDNYYANVDMDITDGSGNDDPDKKAFKERTTTEFDKRNIGTAANMIGINNGYTLKIQGAVVDHDNNDQTYFGPVNGVFEIKLMTLAQNEGGGYIYALNHHDNTNNFLQTTGNFVFPGAAYKSNGTENYNYIYDDCFPMGEGWESYYGWDANKEAWERSSASAAKSRASEPGNCNDEQEVHYWFVSGTNYYYNVTLTAYTYNNGASFTLNNKDNLIYLYGIENGTELNLANVTWEPVTNSTADYESDLQHCASTEGKYDKDYQIFLTVDNNPGQAHSTSEKGYAVMVPRADYSSDSGAITCTDEVAKAAATYNNYTNDATTSNKPLLGITLYDNVDNAEADYYNQHLAEEEHAQIVLTTEKKDDLQFKYTINLTIRYLLGPSISGAPIIENDALPGEYIYANDSGVTVDMDYETMSITERNWYIIDPKYSTSDQIANVVKNIKSTNGTTDGESVSDQKFLTDGQVHIPAYFYRDGWKVIYEIVANGQSFFLDAASATDDYKRDCLVVHNYHRMKPTINGTDIEDLHLSSGARIYIENDVDFAYFFQWLKERGDGAKDLSIYLMTDVKMPETMTVDASQLTFRGTFHGEGHSIDMGKNKIFLGANEGNFHNVGFISRLGSDDACAFNTNTSEADKGITSCFFYNTENVGRGLMVKDTDDGNIYNCFRVAAVDDVQKTEGLERATKDEFDYGEVAYNLNHYYLKKRYNLATGTPDGSLVAPLNEDYREGDYRYASVKGTNSWSLRTDTIPNYRDYKNIRLGHTPGAVTGASATMHDATDPLDKTRARDKDDILLFNEDGSLASGKTEADFDHYSPNFPDDFIFFGQDLAYNSSEDPWPHAIDQTKRVYRASGFYGSKVDYGFHFNEDAAAVQSSLSAIDFFGVRDAKYATTTSGDFKNGYSVGYTPAAQADRKIWYAPAIDLPDSALDNLGLTSFTTATLEGDANHYITKNLLLYRPADKLPMLDEWKYDTLKLASDIYAHIIDVDASAKASTDYFQLVDMEDFNCPIDFEINKSIWYRRQPTLFSSGNNAWEGLCLPFTVRTVYGSVATREIGSKLNHGVMSHFYGKHVGADQEEPSHEYWLRKFTGVATANGTTTAYFDRPGAEDDSNIAEDKRSYHYSNTYFADLYGESYAVHTDKTQAYTAAGTTYTDYPMITAARPYIVSFPGERYFEFDCSGEFYRSKFGTAEAVPQIITYSWTKEAADAAGQTVRVTDDNAPVTFTHDGYSHQGTFTHVDATAADKVIDLFDANGSEFVRGATSEERTIYPFRTYLSQVSGSSPTPVRIGSRAIDGIDVGDDADDSEDDGLDIYVEFNELVIVNNHDYDVTLPLYDLEGRLLEHITARASDTTRLTTLTPGYYLISTLKFRIQ